MESMKIRITFAEEVLGTAPNDETIYRNFIASKAPDAKPIEDEIAAVGVDDVVEKGMTVFPRNKEGTPIIWDYQLKGFFKDACGILSRVSGKVEKAEDKEKADGAAEDGGEKADIKKKKADKKKSAVYESGKLTAYKKIIDGLIFVQPRQIPVVFDGEIGHCERPLRAQTAQGERVALANSETIPEGAYIEAEIKCLQDEHMKAVREWLDYGILRGLGQWRNSGKGRFTWEEIV